MKTKSKTRRAPKRRAQKNYNDENIFNPFAPLMSAMRERAGREKTESGGTFRSAFITVLLIHLIAAMGFAAYNAVSKATRSTATAQTAPKKKSESRVAQILNGPSAKILASEEAEPGQKLEPARTRDSFSNESAAPAKTAQAKPRASFADSKEEDLPPLAAAPAKSAEATKTKPAALAHQEPAKKAFLAATGRLAPTEELTPSEPEVRRAEPVAQPTRPEPVPPQPSTPALSSYVVQAGDNIFTISRRMNVSFTELAQANNLSSPRDVRVGQVLVSPSVQRDAM